MWTAGPVAIDLDTTWPTALVRRVVTAFSAPGAHVALLAWPTPHHEHPRPRLIAINPGGEATHTAADTAFNTALDTAGDTAMHTGPDAEVLGAMAAIRYLDRTVSVEHIPASSTGRHTAASGTAAASRPFWADLIDGGGRAPASTVMESTVASSATAWGPAEPVVGGADLVVTSVAPQRFGTGHADGRGDVSADLVALYAARLLRVGGTLVVLTHCDWSSGELIDPTGGIVAAAQNADLLYLQHVVVVHAPIHDGQFDLGTTLDHDSDCRPGGARAIGGSTVGVHNGDLARVDATAASDAPADAIATAVVVDFAGRSPERGLDGAPEAHQRIHSDLLVFAQPADHQPSFAAASDVPVHVGAKQGRR